MQRIGLIWDNDDWIILGFSLYAFFDDSEYSVIFPRSCKALLTLINKI